MTSAKGAAVPLAQSAGILQRRVAQACRRAGLAIENSPFRGRYWRTLNQDDQVSDPAERRS